MSDFENYFYVGKLGLDTVYECEVCFCLVIEPSVPNHTDFHEQG